MALEKSSRENAFYEAILKVSRELTTEKLKKNISLDFQIMTVTSFRQKITSSGPLPRFDTDHARDKS